MLERVAKSTDGKWKLKNGMDFAHVESRKGKLPILIFFLSNS